MLFTLFDFAVDGSGVKESICQCRRRGFGPWIRKTQEEGLLPFPGRGNDNPLQCCCLENLVARGTQRTTVCGVAKSQT